MRYTLVTAASNSEQLGNKDIQQFLLDVNILLRDGWELAGGISITTAVVNAAPFSEVYIFYAQALIKEREE